MESNTICAGKMPAPQEFNMFMTEAL